MFATVAVESQLTVDDCMQPCALVLVALAADSFLQHSAA